MGRAHLNRRKGRGFLRCGGRRRGSGGRFLVAEGVVHRFGFRLALQFFRHLVAPTENAGQPAGGRKTGRFLPVVGRLRLLSGFQRGSFLLSLTGCGPLGAAGGVLLVDGHALFMDAAAQFAHPLPQLGGGDIKNVQAGTERQHDHDKVRRRTPAEQQQVAAQQSPQRAAAQPCGHAVLVALSHHPGGRDVGGDVRKHDDRAAGEDQPQQQLEHLPQQVFAPRVQNGQITHRRTQHEAATAKQAEQHLVETFPHRAALHKGQHDEQQPRKQGAQPRGHPLLCPALSPRRCASCCRFSFFCCHLPLKPCILLADYSILLLYHGNRNLATKTEPAYALLRPSSQQGRPDMPRAPLLGELSSEARLRGYFPSISRYSHPSASEMPPRLSMSFSRTALRPSSTVPTSMTSSPVRSISSV